MKFLTALGEASKRLVNFITFAIKVGYIAAIVIVILAILMPDNVIKAIEILRGLTM